MTTDLLAALQRSLDAAKPEPRGAVAAQLRHDRPELAEVGQHAHITLAVMGA